MRDESIVNYKGEIVKSTFNGCVTEFVGIFCLSFFITIFTLGLGTPWVVCMHNRWHINHKVIDGKQIVFDGRGIGLFFCYLWWFFLFIITLGIYGFWIRVRYHEWVIKHTHIVRDEYDIERPGESIFSGGATEHIGIAFFALLLTIFTLGFAMPWIICMFTRWRIDNTEIDGRATYFDGSGWGLFFRYCWWFFLMIITLGVYGFWIPLKKEKWFTKHTHLI